MDLRALPGIPTGFTAVNGTERRREGERERGMQGDRASESGGSGRGERTVPVNPSRAVRAGFYSMASRGHLVPHTCVQRGLAMAWLPKNHWAGDPSWVWLARYGWLVGA
jgi:hypothetical protein